MKINLSDLEAKAKECASWDWFDDGSQLAIERDHDYSHLMDEEVRFIGAMSPKTALALIRVARAAIKISDFSTHSAFDELNEALEEIDG